MNAVLDYIEKRKVNYGLFSLSTTLGTSHGLRATHSNISGNNVLHLARRCDNYDEEDDIHNDATIMVLDDALKVVSMAPPIAPRLTDNDVVALPVDDDSPIMASDLLIGKLLTVSLYKNTYVISTKDSLHGNAPIIDGVAAATQEIVLDLIDRIFPYLGLEGLFRANFGGIDCRHFSYTFILSPRSGKFTSNFLDYDFFLVSMYDKANHRFLNTMQITSLVQQLNSGATSRSILQPRYHKVYSIEQLKEVAAKFTRRDYVKGLYLFDSSMNSASWVIAKNNYRINLEKYMRDMVNAYLKNDYIGVMRANESNPGLAPVVHKFINEYKNSAIVTYRDAKMARTKHSFHRRVCGHKADTILYALYEGKINSVNELHKVLKPNKVIRMIEEEYGLKYIEGLINKQENKK